MHTWKWVAKAHQNWPMVFYLDQPTNQQNELIQTITYILGVANANTGTGDVISKMSIHTLYLKGLYAIACSAHFGYLFLTLSFWLRIYSFLWTTKRALSTQVFIVRYTLGQRPVAQICQKLKIQTFLSSPDPQTNYSLKMFSAQISEIPFTPSK